MGKSVNKTKVTHDDGIKKTTHSVIARKGGSKSTPEYHGWGGKDGGHGSKKSDGKWRNRK